MDKDDILRMVQDAGLAVSAVAPEIGVIWCSEEYPIDEEIYRFAELVAAAERNQTWTQNHWTEYERSIAATEREACAKTAMELLFVYIGSYPINEQFADAIRARGQE